VVVGTTKENRKEKKKRKEKEERKKGGVVNIDTGNMMRQWKKKICVGVLYYVTKWANKKK
jgi:hypothetical protein